MKRRDFFKHTAPLVTAPILLNSGVARAFNSFDLFTSLSCETVRERFLVVVQLRGANDGLNTIIRPEYDSAYQAQRPDVYIPPTDLLSSSNSVFNGINFHPNLGKIRDLANKDCLNVIQSVGYPTMNRSHFKATDLWLTGGDGTNTAIPSRPDETSSSITEGWMGLYLENIFEGYDGKPSAFMPDPLGIHLKSKSQSLGFHTHDQHLAAVNLGVKTTDGFYALLSEQGISPEFFAESSCGDRVDFMKLIDRETQVYGKRIQETFDRGQNSSVDYGNHDLAAQLRTVARLVNGGSKTKVFLTEMSGFDTHVNQLTGHANLMTHLSESVHAFMDDLDKMGILDRCLIVTFSEFGRKFISNASNGTDHGTLAPMLVFGHPDKINSGLTGPKLNVTTIDGQGAPTVATGNHVDYRNVFRSILNKWLGAEQDTLDVAFSAHGEQNLDLIKTGSDASGTAGCYVPNQEDNEHIVNVSIPTVEDEVSTGTYVPAGITAGGVSTEPLHEITACNYVDLLPGFVAACGTNVIVYPFACQVGPPPAALIADGGGNQAEEYIEAVYTQQQQVGKESQLVEYTPTFERIKIKLAPNPATDFVNVSFTVRPGEKDVRLELLDAKGSIVPVRVPAFSSQDADINVTLDISHVSPGVYYIRYVSHAMIETFKVVIM